MSHETYFVVSWLVLAGLLFLPVARLIWVLSVRRLERRLGQPLDDAERRGQLVRARVIAAFVVILFAFLFNAQTIGIPRGG